jgi:outer membrane receptor protein involved in Fe transport
MELNTGKVFNAYNPGDHFSLLRTYNGALSYVTGSHAFRFGATLSEGNRRLVERYTGDLTMTFRSGLPQSVTLRTPLDQRDAIRNDLGIYAQDRWTLGRATINAGLRYDWFVGEVQDEELPASRWNPAARFSGFRVQNWKDLSPRLGVSYDLFGNGKTAVKASVARYVNGEAVTTAAANNPQTTIGRTDVRTWTDVNGDYTIFDPMGAFSPPSSGRPRARTSASLCRRRRRPTRQSSTASAFVRRTGNTPRACSTSESDRHQQWAD